MHSCGIVRVVGPPVNLQIARNFIGVIIRLDLIVLVVARLHEVLRVRRNVHAVGFERESWWRVNHLVVPRYFCSGGTAQTHAIWLLGNFARRFWAMKLVEVVV